MIHCEIYDTSENSWLCDTWWKSSARQYPMKIVDPSKIVGYIHGKNVWYIVPSENCWVYDTRRKLLGIRYQMKIVGYTILGENYWIYGTLWKSLGIRHPLATVKHDWLGRRNYYAWGHPRRELPHQPPPYRSNPSPWRVPRLGVYHIPGVNRQPRYMYTLGMCNILGYKFYPRV
jgi:hypothetical protein